MTIQNISGMNNVVRCYWKATVILSYFKFANCKFYILWSNQQCSICIIIISISISISISINISISIK